MVLGGGFCGDFVREGVGCQEGGGRGRDVRACTVDAEGAGGVGLYCDEEMHSVF